MLRNWQKLVDYSVQAINSPARDIQDDEKERHQQNESSKSNNEAQHALQDASSKSNNEAQHALQDASSKSNNEAQHDSQNDVADSSNSSPSHAYEKLMHELTNHEQTNNENDNMSKVSLFSVIHGASEEINNQKCFSLYVNLTENDIKKAFMTIVSLVAEDTSIKIDGSDFWDMEKLATRRFTKSHLSKCTSSFLKKEIIVVLDTSPSCQDQANFYKKIAQASMKFKDIILIDAPNGFSTKNIEEIHDNWHRKYKGRHVIYFGDFDGANIVIEASRYNNVFWLSCEEKFTAIQQHPLFFDTDLDLSMFKGKYYKCTNEQDLFHLIKKFK